MDILVSHWVSPDHKGSQEVTPLNSIKIPCWAKVSPLVTGRHKVSAFVLGSLNISSLCLCNTDTSLMCHWWQWRLHVTSSDFKWYLTSIGGWIQTKRWHRVTPCDQGWYFCPARYLDGIQWSDFLWSFVIRSDPMWHQNVHSWHFSIQTQSKRLQYVLRIN